MDALLNNQWSKRIPRKIRTLGNEDTTYQNVQDTAKDVLEGNGVPTIKR